MDLHMLLQTGPARASDLLGRLGETSNGAVKTRERLFSELKSELERHTSLEETHLFPVLRRNAEARPIVAGVMKDNSELRTKLSELDALPKNDEAFSVGVRELQKTFRRHARTKTRQLLPAVNRAVTEEQAQRIAGKIEASLASGGQIQQEDKAESRTRVRLEREPAATERVVAAQQPRSEPQPRAPEPTTAAQRTTAQRARSIADREQQAEAEKQRTTAEQAAAERARAEAERARQAKAEKQRAAAKRAEEQAAAERARAAEAERARQVEAEAERQRTAAKQAAEQAAAERAKAVEAERARQAEAERKRAAAEQAATELAKAAEAERARQATQQRIAAEQKGVQEAAAPPRLSAQGATPADILPTSRSNETAPAPAGGNHAPGQRTDISGTVVGAMTEIGSAWVGLMGKAYLAGMRMSNDLVAQAAERQRQLAAESMRGWAERNAKVVEMTMRTRRPAIRPKEPESDQ